MSGLILIGIVAIVVSGILYFLKLDSTHALLIGVIGIIISGLLSNKYYNSSDPVRRMNEAMEGIGSYKVIPAWVSWINVVSFGFLIYGVVTLFV